MKGLPLKRCATPRSKLLIHFFSGPFGKHNFLSYPFLLICYMLNKKLFTLLPPLSDISSSMKDSFSFHEHETYLRT